MGDFGREEKYPAIKSAFGGWYMIVYLGSTLPTQDAIVAHEG